MRLDYGCVPKKRTVLSKQLLIAAGLLILPVSMRLNKLVASEPAANVASTSEQMPAPKPDPRTIRLESFLTRLHCPIASMAGDFVHAADQNRLDWRLLPSISVIESGGGKAYRNNNIFGWNNGLEPFPSLRAGLDVVASRLAHSPLYRNLDSLGKLHIYNPDESYADKVLDVMHRISPKVNLQEAVNRVPSRANPTYAAE